jgi:putative tricarboxylic transport membrane protein
MKKDKEYKREGMERRDFLKLMGGVGGASVLSSFSLPPGSQAAAKEIYPVGDLTFICSMPPGGGYDLTARGSAPFLSKALREVSRGAKGGNVQIKNIVGGAGARAAYYLFNDARPDGYTIGDINRGGFYSFMMGKDKLPFDVRDFTYLYSLSTISRVLVGSKRSGITSWEAMIAKSKKEPIKWAVSTVGGGEHLDTIYVTETTGIPSMLTVWSGTSQTHGALMRGDVDVTVVSYDSVKALIDAGEVNVLVTFTEKRILSNVPTIVEKGFPKIPSNVGGLGGKIVIAPPKLDPEAKRILVAAARKMVVDPGFIEFCEKIATELDPLFGKDLDNLVKDNIEFYTRMAPIYKKYGL